MSQSTAHPAIQLVSRLNHYLSTDFLGGPKLIKLAWVVNFQKCSTFLYVLGLMYYFNNFSAGAYVYLALHGSYGFCWLLKHYALPDPNWERRVTVGGAIMSFVMVLGPYWSFAYLLVSGWTDQPDPSFARLSFAIALHTLGVVIMMTADAQKYYTLKVKRGLIRDGMFRYVRHPNYLGEMMLYGAYAVIVNHWIPWAVLAWVWGILFFTNIMMKEASMSRYPEWAAYKASSGLLLPWPFGPRMHNAPDGTNPAAVK